jgi:hypothetical protein
MEKPWKKLISDHLLKKSLKMLLYQEICLIVINSHIEMVNLFYGNFTQY